MSQGGSWGHRDFLSKCGDILSAVQGHLGQGAPIFGAPVNPKDYPDYPRCAILALQPAALGQAMSWWPKHPPQKRADKHRR